MPDELLITCEAGCGTEQAPRKAVSSSQGCFPGSVLPTSWQSLPFKESNAVGMDSSGDKAQFGSFHPQLLEGVTRTVVTKSSHPLTYFSSSRTQSSLTQCARKTVITASHVITPECLMITKIRNQPSAFSTGSDRDTINLLYMVANDFHQ